MPNPAFHQIWLTYESAWRNIPATDRQTLLEQSLVDNVAFSNPLTEGSGLDPLTRQIEDLQRTRPGTWFETREFITHHDRSISHWAMHAADDSILVLGSSVARFGPDGRITELTGFWPH